MVSAEHLLENCFSLKLRQASRLMTRLFDRIMHPVGIRYTQLCLLLIFQKSAGESMARVSSTIGMERTTLSRLLVKLKDSDLIEVNQEYKGNKIGMDKYVLTQKGKDAILSGLEVWENCHDEVLKQIASTITNNKDFSDISIFNDFKSDLDKIEEALESTTFKKIFKHL
jgi:DNA-binding MarR family transcriptional regulator